MKIASVSSGKKVVTKVTNTATRIRTLHEVQQDIDAELEVELEERAAAYKDARRRELGLT